MCCFPSPSLFPLPCSVCMLSACSVVFVSAAFVRLRNEKWKSLVLFCLRDTEHLLTVAGIPFWVVSVYTYWLLAQTDSCQVYFKLGQISVLCQSAFQFYSSLALRSFTSSEFPNVFMADANVIGADNGDACFYTVAGKQKSISPVL